jgi:hypothetical protein
MFQIENYDVQETRRIAKAEGEAERTIELAKKLLAVGDSIDKVIMVTGLSRDEVEKLLEKN